MIYRISLILEALLVIKCVYDLYNERFKLRTELVIFMGLDLILMECVCQEYVPDWCSVLVYVMLVVYCMVVLESKVKAVVVNLIMAIVLLGLLQIICFCGVYALLGTRVESGGIALITYVVMWCVYLALERVVRFHRLALYFQRSYVCVRVSLVFVSLAIIGSIIVTRLYEKMYGMAYIMVAMAMVLVCVMAVSWIKNKERTMEAEAHLKAHTLYEKSYENLILQIRRRQHEFDNHISAIYSQHMLYKDYDTLVAHQQQYCKSISEDNKYAKLLKLGDGVLAGFLYGKFAEAENRGIKVWYRVDTARIMQDIPQYKLIEIVGNLLDNAIQAQQPVLPNMDREEPAIRVSITSEKGLELIRVENISEFIQPKELNRIFQRGYSSKGSDRGLGLYNIKRIVAEYGYSIICYEEIRAGSNWVGFLVKKNTD